MTKEKTEPKVADRRLGDEWLDWDGKSSQKSTEADYRVFLGLTIVTTILLILTAGLFLWLIYPRLVSAGSILAQSISVLFFAFCSILFIWLVAFNIAALTNRPITRWMIIPQLVNKLLGLVFTVGRGFGLSKEKLTNSFMKVHNVLLGAESRRTTPDKLMLLLPRCLTKENNQDFRKLRDKYKFHLHTVGGGTQARLKIREIRPHVIIAIACERDLLSGFRDVNTHIPVIGFPNKRPEGPCKNTCVDLNEIEQSIKRCLR